MKKLRILLVVAVLALTGAATLHAGQDTLTQVSTIDALMSGIYDGETTLASLRQKGDFGLGTFNALDGEMTLLDGIFYQIKSTGAVERPELTIKTPFATVTFFEPDTSVPLEGGLDFRTFTARTEKLLPTPNIFYAIKVTGTFRYVKTRSVPRQKQPYKPLAEVTKTQPVFEFKNVEGTIVGFYSPSYVKGINVPGYHLHFLTADRKAGGHLLDFVIEKGTMEIDDTSEFTMILPSDRPFYQADLTADREKELQRVEK